MEPDWDAFHTNQKKMITWTTPAPPIVSWHDSHELIRLGPEDKVSQLFDALEDKFGIKLGSVRCIYENFGSGSPGITTYVTLTNGPQTFETALDNITLWEDMIAVLLPLSCFPSSDVQ